MIAQPRRAFLSLFDEFYGRIPLREGVAAAAFRAETDCLPQLLEFATLTPGEEAAAHALATRLVRKLRGERNRGGVEGLIREYDLSNEEGVALMCLAEALLRIPDAETRNALIRDKIGGGDWRSHLGHSPSPFVNAATWALVITGRMTATSHETNLTSALVRIIRRSGEPLIRAGVDMAMRLLGEHFVAGRDIEEALSRARTREREGFRHSYDMLGEAALTATDAQRYFAAYARAVGKIGAAAERQGTVERPGISIKLSALHPRYARAQKARVMDELYPRLLALAVQARSVDIGLNIDAEEADRLELSLDLLERLCFEPELAGWNGVGFVVQAYGRRAPHVIDWLVDLARRSERQLMVRLVKGAYWDSEIKRAQALGLPEFPVLTRKIHTDVSYLACARKMLDAGRALYPQFATHNARTVAAVYEMAGADAPRDAYEFQCLHGMGEPLYEDVVAKTTLDRPCRIYAPVGPHETLLAYLVRRLLENGANSSFVNLVADPTVAIDDLVADPVAAARALEPPGRPHDAIARPRDLYLPSRRNSAGFDLTDETTLFRLSEALGARAERRWTAAPMLADGVRDRAAVPIRNPARRDEIVGLAAHAALEDIEAALRFAAAERGWAETAPARRAKILMDAADRMECDAADFHLLLISEAGKTISAAIAEVREATDFLRYYAAGVADWANATHRSLGPVVCISPWNFPLAIFTGQIAAALAAGNAVLAKPAEETPLIAARAVALLLEAGVPGAALQLLPGEGDVGAALVVDERVAGVLFTGSTEVARRIQAALSTRLGADGAPIPLVAETGGQNAMAVGSSALPEQAVGDILASAFDSAGQRCSALRLLCLQEDVADRILDMLKGAAAELAVGDPAWLSTNVGPVISADAQAAIAQHVEAARNGGAAVWSTALRDDCGLGSFVAPTIIEIASVAQMTHEVFGPALHVLRFPREGLDRLVEEICALGYGLTFGLQTRIDETVERIVKRAPAGNIYVNRNMIGAVVGTQPFGGHGLSGTGPKAGGPLYLKRLLARRPPDRDLVGTAAPAAERFARWLEGRGRTALAERCRGLSRRSPLGVAREMPGPVGELNVYELRRRGTVLCRADGEQALFVQIAAALATGNTAVFDAPAGPAEALRDLDRELAEKVRPLDGGPPHEIDCALVEPGPLALATLKAFADRPGPIVPVFAAPTGDGDESLPLDMLVREITVSVNTAAAGGDASLMTLGG
ncbi:bifunctional proline dehydrogenase/L-glutamate gamma-semialdehyde dehydrogenase PutA [Methylopila sp. M107]|uniref:bifunctional proline dehydrogenase/L-glutamate gamma-semialdehyde dehydrogenase PutA n=1 Tax=Methylopila sp. M107 TaxID=1101190 RepID=UPI0003A1D595|nr:bifunctional proline dehydrogenase/L-glutamate gamma-semialdehyde dehydrogenase PutA [Methylopila sp. M107]